MDAKRLVIGTLLGGIVVYALHYLIFVLAFGSFYAANVGSATGVARDPEIWWAVLLGCCAYAALITLMIPKTGAITTGGAMKSGAVVGFLLWVTADFVFYGTTNMQNLTTTIVDPLLELVRGGISGAIIAVILSKVGGGARVREGRETVGV